MCATMGLGMDLFSARFVRHLTLCAAFVLVGCSGANCPFNRPACCDNALFGCGPFDLPQGCSCGDYFSRSFHGAPKSEPAMIAQSPKRIQDSTWRISLEKQSGNCSYLRESIQTTLLVRSQGRQLQVKALGYPRFRGSRTSRSMKIRSKRQLGFPRCMVQLDASIVLSSSSQGNAQGAVDIACSTQALSCSATFSGVARKL
jgi:hypothetical protein